MCVFVFVCACVCMCCVSRGEGEGRSRGRRRWRRGKKMKKEKEKAQFFPWCHLLCLGRAETSGTHHLPSAPPEKRWFLDINLTWGHSISLPKGTAGFSNLLCQMREFRDLRENFHCNVKVGVLRTPPTPHNHPDKYKPHLFHGRLRLRKTSSHSWFSAHTRKKKIKSSRTLRL